MSCPKCGGSKRRSVGSDSWECISPVPIPQSQLSAWDLWDPWRAALYATQACGHIYADR